MSLNEDRTLVSDASHGNDVTDLPKEMTAYHSQTSYSAESSRAALLDGLAEFHESPDGLKGRAEASRKLAGELIAANAWLLNRKNGNQFGFRDDRRRIRCSFAECTAVPIEKSHVLARGVALSAIAEKSLLITPQLDLKGFLSAQATSMEVASTFPGYCIVHEAYFQEFERQRELTEPAHFALQLMRSAARESWRGLRTYFHFQNVSQIYEACFAGIPVSKSARQHWRDRIQAPLANLSSFGTGLFANMHHVHNDAKRVVEAKDGTVPPWMAVRHHDLSIPIALSGGTELISARGRSTPLVFVSMPNGSQAITIIGTLDDEAAFIRSYAHENLATTSLLDVEVERWMTRTDHWFAQPSWWDGKSGPWRARVSDSLGKSIHSTLHF